MKVTATVFVPVLGLLLTSGCSTRGGDGSSSAATDFDPVPVGDRLTSARSESGQAISWQEHIIDDPATSGLPLAGSDGLEMADLDGDGYLDIVSVHESDTVYDGVSDGHVRIAWGSADPNRWTSRTLVEGPLAGGAEDVAIVDLNRDGWLDVLIACELAHIIYLQNPGPGARQMPWRRLVPPVTRNRGSFIRVFAADFDGDGQAEPVVVNKGAQNPSGADALRPNPISWIEIQGDPMVPQHWVEHELTRVAWPINAPIVDLDGDGDLDIVGGSTAEARIFWFENVSQYARPAFVEHRIRVPGTTLPAAAIPERLAGRSEAVISGFNMDFHDLSGDGRMDIVLAERSHLVWLEQPPGAATEEPWILHYIGSNAPDTATGLRLGDLDGDGDPDLFVGSYSRGPRDHDGDVPLTSPMGRLAWFENPGDAAGDWERHDVSRRVRGMFDAFEFHDADGDGDLDVFGTRGNSEPWDGVFWLEQVREAVPGPAFRRARTEDSAERPLPAED